MRSITGARVSKNRAIPHAVLASGMYDDMAVIAKIVPDFTMVVSSVDNGDNVVVSSDYLKNEGEIRQPEDCMDVFQQKTRRVLIETEYDIPAGLEIGTVPPAKNSCSGCRDLYWRHSGMSYDKPAATYPSCIRKKRRTPQWYLKSQG